MSIECRTKGIPMREGTRVDADGYHVFTLNEAKHDPFDVFNRLMLACGATPVEIDVRFEKIMRARADDAEKARRARRD